MADVHITPEGLEAVEKELDELTSQKRPSIVAKIKAARELGDLSENFEYHAAKNEQGMMEARIKELESIIKNHVLIEARTEKGVVGMGDTVRFVEKELDELTSQKRPSIVAKIKAARELGDLSENFEYHAAKNEQGMMEARIKELESIIKNHVLIEARTEKGVVGMGNTVRFAEDRADEERYPIVGPAEADPKAGRVSYESALGKALIGHRGADDVDINTPGGRYNLRITGIE